ncbi:hypothetical protein QWY22_05895 [Planococcus liqunii]|uniref:Uncharacterized protein n=1 Tax=Planococcus liqunii TaxID=3058394 RepID=A0ABT8MUR0_9BACL|nr:MULTISPECIES: hypothetical protein [unclassified Planococcus (in: firmicutes)]MDN7228635.1 hypothetical protein [Planococcus sp. N064]WKA52109.1 hypothetical protein QWY22_05895 [Planococcus sp. N056]
MKHFQKAHNPATPYEIFEFKKYEIPLHEIMLFKKHETERVSYALYCEEGIVYLLTNVSVNDAAISGYGVYAKPYCKLGDIGSYSLATLDKDSYNWYMTHAR